MRLRLQLPADTAAGAPALPELPQRLRMPTVDAGMGPEDRRGTEPLPPLLRHTHTLVGALGWPRMFMGTWGGRESVLSAPQLRSHVIADLRENNCPQKAVCKRVLHCHSGP